MSEQTLDFAHRYLTPQHEGAPTLLLLHGTGGTEDDLLGLGDLLMPGAGRLSPRGKVLENGMSRFFRRLSEGVFDLDDVKRRSSELAEFVAAASDRYRFDAKRVIAVGYSNGANIAASLLLLHPEALAGAVLFHAMVPIVPDGTPDLTDVPVFMGSGRQDSIIPSDQSEGLERLLTGAGAEVTHHWEPGGHALTRQEIEAATAWLRERRPAWS